MECDAVVVAERSREEENGVAMVALWSCDGGAAEKVRRGVAAASGEFQWWPARLAAAAAVKGGRKIRVRVLGDEDDDVAAFHWTAC